MKYKNWEVSKINDTSWKASRDGHQINVCNPRLLRAMIDEDTSRKPYEKQTTVFSYEDEKYG